MKTGSMLVLFFTSLASIVFCWTYPGTPLTGMDCHHSLHAPMADPTFDFYMCYDAGIHEGYARCRWDGKASRVDFRLECSRPSGKCCQGCPGIPVCCQSDCNRCTWTGPLCVTANGVEYSKECENGYSHKMTKCDEGCDQTGNQRCRGCVYHGDCAGQVGQYCCDSHTLAFCENNEIIYTRECAGGCKINATALVCNTFSGKGPDPKFPSEMAPRTRAFDNWKSYGPVLLYFFALTICCTLWYVCVFCVLSCYGGLAEQRAFRYHRAQQTMEIFRVKREMEREKKEMEEEMEGDDEEMGIVRGGPGDQKGS